MYEHFENGFVKYYILTPGTSRVLCTFLKLDMSNHVHSLMLLVRHTGGRLAGAAALIQGGCEGGGVPFGVLLPISDRNNNLSL